MNTLCFASDFGEMTPTTCSLHSNFEVYSLLFIQPVVNLGFKEHIMSNYSDHPGETHLAGNDRFQRLASQMSRSTTRLGQRTLHRETMNVPLTRVTTLRTTNDLRQSQRYAERSVDIAPSCALRVPWRWLPENTDHEQTIATIPR